MAADYPADRGRSPLIDRSDDPTKGGRFVMSLSEGRWC